MFKERLDILLEADMIQEPVYAFVLNFTNKILKEHEGIDSDKLSMFITHLAMATQRVINKQDENEVSESILESLKQEPSYEVALTYYDYIIANSVVEYPKSEKGYLMIHLCNLLEGR